MTKFVERSHNRFGHQYIRVAEKAQRVVGIVTLLPVLHPDDDTDGPAVLSRGQRLWLKLLDRLILRHVLHRDYPPGSFYVGNLAVAAEYRNQGIGRQLLSQCINDAVVASRPIYISVDIHNPRAQKLYESLGFQVIATNTITILGTAVGSRTLFLEHPSKDMEGTRNASSTSPPQFET
ncbi:GNAT family N-acetyltransferase [Leptolyngbya sp. FACHB-8]|nr:N-acetyltransferase [Leptolyngbya sp. FACHB-8]MBD1911438.1 GNAT family N-acetyltransferase [Leptolyngbya sp. FACHB-8]